MTSAVLAVVDHRQFDTDERYKKFLAKRLEPVWRPGEWNPETLIFTGDPENPKTFVYLCAGPDCRNPNGVRNTLCPYCVARRKPRSRTLTRRFHDTPFDPCIVADDVQCGRPRYSATGLCFTHQSRYKEASKATRGLGLEQYIASATPLGPLPVCAVWGCLHQVFYGSTPLCSTHHHQYRARAESSGRRMSQLDFAAQALPLIRGHEFTLAGCSATLAVEVLFLLQERDRRGFGISILRMRNLMKSARGADTFDYVNPSGALCGNLSRTH